MKFLIQLMAVILLWIFVACNNQTGKSAHRTSTTEQAAVADFSIVQPAPVSGAATVGTTKFTPPKIIKDQEVKEEEKPFNNLKAMQAF
jgi:Ca-activated chloride channel family protein